MHVLTGVNSARDDILAHAGERPDFIGADLRSLLVPHTAPTPAGEGWWDCDGSAARVVDGRLELREADSTTDPVDLVRAACAAAWAYTDAGGVVDPTTVPDLAM